MDGLYQIQREYNFSQTGEDRGGEDKPLGYAGTFNQLIKILQQMRPDLVRENSLENVLAVDCVVYTTGEFGVWKQLRSTTKTCADRSIKPVVNKLLLETMHGNQEKIEQFLLRADTSLDRIGYLTVRTNDGVDKAAYVTDFSGRTPTNCSPFMYAVWAMDAFMLKMMLKLLRQKFDQALIKSTQEEASEEEQAAGRGEMKICEQIRNKLIKQYHEVRQKGLSYTHAQTKMIYPPQTHTNSDGEIVPILTEDGRHIPDIAQRGIEESFSISVENEPHFNFLPLLDALGTYIDLYYQHIGAQQDPALYYSEPLEKYWRHIVGGAQQDIPAHVAQEYCHPYKSLHSKYCPRRVSPIPLFDLNNKRFSRSLELVNFLMPAPVGAEEEGVRHAWWNSVGDLRLGFNFSVTRGLSEEVAWVSETTRACEVRLDLNGLTALSQVRSQNMINLEQDLRDLFPEFSQDVEARPPVNGL